MFIMKRDRKFKNVVAMIVLATVTVVVDSNTSSRNQSIQEAKLFGVEKTYGECL